jgi:hypothetical protein
MVNTCRGRKPNLGGAYFYEADSATADVLVTLGTHVLTGELTTSTIEQVATSLVHCDILC